MSSYGGKSEKGPSAAVPPGLMTYGDDLNPALRARPMPSPAPFLSSSSPAAPTAPASEHLPPPTPPRPPMRLSDDLERSSVLFSLACGAAGALALGVFMLFVGARGASLPCEVPLARFALVDGSISLVLAVLQTVLAVSMLPAAAAARGSLRGAWLVIGAGVLFMLVLASLGVRVWGTALAFGGGLWTRMAAADGAAAAATAASAIGEVSVAVVYPCDPFLYNSSAIFLLVIWGLVAIAAAFGCCVCCCVVVGAGCFYACCEAGRRGGYVPLWGSRAVTKRTSGSGGGGGGDNAEDSSDDAETALFVRSKHDTPSAAPPPPVFA